MPTATVAKKVNYTRAQAIAKLRQNDDACDLEESERMNYSGLSNKRLREELCLNGLVVDEEFGEVVDQ